MDEYHRNKSILHARPDLDTMKMAVQGKYKDTVKKN